MSLQESQADPVDHPVDLGVHSLLLKELKLNKKDLKPGKKKRKKAEAEGEEEDESPEDTEAGETKQCLRPYRLAWGANLTGHAWQMPQLCQALLQGHQSW